MNKHYIECTSGMCTYAFNCFA